MFYGSVVQKKRGLVLIGYAAGEGITPLNGARGRQRLDFLSVLSFRTSSAADAKTSNVEEAGMDF